MCVCVFMCVVVCLCVYVCVRVCMKQRERERERWVLNALFLYKLLCKFLLFIFDFIQNYVCADYLMILLLVLF